jgi:simple sugar transport system substrate-binding protein
LTLDRTRLLKRIMVGAGAGAATLGGRVPVEAIAAAAESGGGDFASHPRWKFAFVNHLTTSPLFVPLQYGIQDACSLVRCSYRWTGSARSDTKEVVEAVQAAVESKADGIALPLVDAKALAGPLEEAAHAGIVVVSYHARARGTDRSIPFVGQDAYSSGMETGRRIGGLVRSGEVALFVEERGVQPVERRLQGALAGIRKSAPSVRARIVRTGRDPYVATDRIDRYVTEHKKLRGLFALELGPSAAAGRAVVKRGLRAKGVRAGGHGVLPTTLELIQDGQLDFTVDEQPYFQGFVPALQLFLAKIAGGLLAPSDTDIPTVFVTRRNLTPYQAKTRYEGSSSKQRYPIR